MYKKYITALTLITSITSVIVSCIAYNKCKKIEKRLNSVPKSNKHKGTKPNNVLDEYIKDEEELINNDIDKEFSPSQDESENDDCDLPDDFCNGKYIISVNYTNMADKISVVDILDYLTVEQITDFLPLVSSNIISTTNYLTKAFPNSVVVVNNITDDEFEKFKFALIHPDRVFNSVDNVDKFINVLSDKVNIIHKKQNMYIEIVIDSASDTKYIGPLNKDIKFLLADYVLEISRNDTDIIALYPRYLSPRYKDNKSVDDNVSYDVSKDSYFVINDNSITEDQIVTIIKNIVNVLPNTIVRVPKNAQGYKLIDSISMIYPNALVNKWIYADTMEWFYDIDLKISDDDDKQKPSGTSKEPAGSVGHIDYL